MNLMKLGEKALAQNASLARISNTRSSRKSSNPNKGRRGQVFQTFARPGRGLTAFILFLVQTIGLFPAVVFALPSNPSVQAGSATTTQTAPDTLTINQSTQKAIINWDSFSISNPERVDFQLSHGASGVTLNRVTGDTPSNIFGTLTSNGQFMLINPNGILFGANSRVDVNGLVATTSDISNSDFMAGNYNFNIAPDIARSIINRGSLNVADGGLLALVAPGVANEGIINAKLGRVSLAGANTFTLDLYGDQLVNIGLNSQVTEKVIGPNGDALNALVSNSGSIFADAGTVRLDVNSAKGIVDNVINMDGVIQAQSFQQKNGKIILSGGSSGNVQVNGTLDASGYGAGETGGTVHVLGENLNLLGATKIDTSGDFGGGEILVGGDYQGKGAVQNAQNNNVYSNAEFYADALTQGNGGRIIFWADRRTQFLGRLKARGGKLFGDGGFAEVSGKEELFFNGTADLSASNGKTGSLLLDPDTITVKNGSGSTASGAVTIGGSSVNNATIYENTLEALSSTTDIILLADDSITMENLSDGTLDLAQGSGNSVTFTATAGNITFSDTSDALQTAGGAITFTAGGTITLGALTSGGGDITLKSKDLNFAGAINSGAGSLAITAQNRVVSFGVTTITPTTLGLGDATGTDMTLSGAELGRITTTNLTLTSASVTVDNVTAANSNNISGTVTLNATEDNSSVTFNNTSTFNTLTVNADQGIAINGNLTTDTGALTLEGDADNSADTGDSISIASGVTLTSASSMTLDATTGGISSAGTASFNATGNLAFNNTFISGGATTLSAGTTGDITLTNSANDFTGAVSITSARNVTLVDTNAIDLGASTISGTFGLTAGGAVTDSGTLAVTGTTTITAGSTNNITLDDSSNNFGTIAITSGNNVTLVDAGAIDLGASTISGTFGLTAAGAVTDSGTLAITGVTTIAAGSGNNITLDSAANNFSTIDRKSTRLNSSHT